MLQLCVYLSYIFFLFLCVYAPVMLTHKNQLVRFRKHHDLASKKLFGGWKMSAGVLKNIQRCDLSYSRPVGSLVELKHIMIWHVWCRCQHQTYVWFAETLIANIISWFVSLDLGLLKHLSVCDDCELVMKTHLAGSSNQSLSAVWLL